MCLSFNRKGLIQRVICSRGPQEDEMRARTKNPSSPGQTILECIPKRILAITQRNACTSPLLRLPAELRLQIWEYSMSCPYISISSRWIRYRGRSTLRGVPRNDDDTVIQHVALRLPATSRQIYAETRLLILHLTTFKITFPYQFQRVSEHPLFRNIQSLEASNSVMLKSMYHYFDLGESEGFYELTPRSENGHLTKQFPRLKHIELSWSYLQSLFDFDEGAQKQLGSFTKESAESYRRLVEQRIRKREGRPLLTFSWK